MNDCDIDADSAWLFALADSNLRVAVIDNGGEFHEDLDGSGLPYGRDFYQYDADPTPYDSTYNHGMACAGILAAVHNGKGVRGVNPGCTLVPIKIFSRNTFAGPDSIADAIYYANSIGCRVVSNSWTYRTTAPITSVQAAIRYVSNQCGGGQKSPQARLGTVMVFAAGDDRTYGYSVEFPANMPEVIAIGAIDKSNHSWWYSCRGSAIDLVAPAGDLPYSQHDGDMYTVDMTGNRGWNPQVTGSGGDAGLEGNYTRIMGGTSASCPQVAGIVSLLMARNAIVNWCNPVPEIYDILTQSADDITADGWDDSTGLGRANAYKALVATSRGDINGDAFITLTDVVWIVNEAFRGGQSPSLHHRLSDVNCDGNVTVQDVVLAVNVAFRGFARHSPCYNF